ncbi:hypothetical protein RSJ42_08850 [Methanosarcina hadiensis]|uniref:hypothetical protein n=1 Tax=Methanosarcina hadiensis TaxID=3078083 RepID=UPI0039777DE2
MTIIMLSLSLLTLISGVSGAEAPENWKRIDTEGLFQASGQYSIQLVIFESELYVQAENGLYKYKDMSWEKQTISSKDLNPFKSADLSQFSSGTDVKPILIFNGQLYARVYPKGSTTFEIWRSSDFGKEKMTWEKVVSDGFGNPLNHNLGLLTEYNKKLVVVTTNTRTNPNVSFGDSNYYGSGIQVWESPSGDAGSWYQINKDGFGTELTIFGRGGKKKTVRINQDFGSGAIYNGHLYIGTLCHLGGAQVWRYDGTGLNGWKDVTPWGDVTSPGALLLPFRVASMAVYDNSLYLAEGFPTGNLQKYNGTNWEMVVAGPNPFASTNIGIVSLAVKNGRLYAATYGNSSYNCGQVWSYPSYVRIWVPKWYYWSRWHYYHGQIPPVPPLPPIENM